MKPLLGKTACMVIPVAIISAMFGLAVYPPRGKVMTTLNQSGYGGQKQTKVELESGEIVITSQDAEEIGRALDDYLKNSRQEIAKKVPHNWLHLVPENAGEGFIDEDGGVRVNRWVLEAWGDNLVLAYRVVTPTTTTVGYRFVASLERLNQQWKVTSVSFEKLIPRRR